MPTGPTAPPLDDVIGDTPHHTVARGSWRGSWREPRGSLCACRFPAALSGVALRSGWSPAAGTAGWPAPRIGPSHPFFLSALRTWSGTFGCPHTTTVLSLVRARAYSNTHPGAPPHLLHVLPRSPSWLTAVATSPTLAPSLQSPRSAPNRTSARCADVQPPFSAAPPLDALARPPCDVAAAHLRPTYGWADPPRERRTTALGRCHPPHEA